MNPADVRVVFMGSPWFAVPSLRALHAAGYHLAGVVTQPDRPAGRGGDVIAPPVKGAALQLDIPVFQPPNLKDDEHVEHLAALVPDLFVVAAYGKILSQRVLDIPKRGALNVHASLLPRWRGASPIAAAILAGDTETGVSIMEMVREMDAGPVVASRELPIEPTDTTGTLEPRLAELGARLLVEVLPGWYEGRIKAKPQDDSQATYCSLVAKSDGHLRAEMTASEAERAVRAYDPWPGAYVEYRGQRLAIWSAHVVPSAAPHPPGTLLLEGRQPAIQFARGLLVLDEVQRQGARRISGEAFVNGERGKLAETVGLA